MNDNLEQRIDSATPAQVRRIAGDIDAATVPDLEGLRMVRDAVLSVVDERFAMGTWRCGTSCCAIGWFCTFNPDDELRLVRLRTILEFYRPVLKNSPLDRGAAVAARFGISFLQVVHLFGDPSEQQLDESGKLINGPKDRAEFLFRIEQFILDHSPKVFPHHAQPKCLEPREYATAHIEAERDAMDHAENAPDAYDGGEPLDTDWR